MVKFSFQNEYVYACIVGIYMSIPSEHVCIQNISIRSFFTYPFKFKQNIPSSYFSIFLYAWYVKS